MLLRLNNSCRLTSLGLLWVGVLFGDSRSFVSVKHSIDIKRCNISCKVHFCNNRLYLLGYLFWQAFSISSLIVSTFFHRNYCKMCHNVESNTINNTNTNNTTHNVVNKIVYVNRNILRVSLSESYNILRVRLSATYNISRLRASATHDSLIRTWRILQ